MCRFDMKQMINGEELFVKKQWRLMTNSPCIGQDVRLKCQARADALKLPEVAEQENQKCTQNGYARPSCRDWLDK